MLITFPIYCVPTQNMIKNHNGTSIFMSGEHYLEEQ